MIQSSLQSVKSSPPTWRDVAAIVLSSRQHPVVGRGATVVAREVSVVDVRGLIERTLYIRITWLRPFGQFA